MGIRSTPSRDLAGAQRAQDGRETLPMRFGHDQHFGQWKHMDVGIGGPGSDRQVADERGDGAFDRRSVERPGRGNLAPRSVGRRDEPGSYQHRQPLLRRANVARGLREREQRAPLLVAAIQRLGVDDEPWPRRRHPVRWEPPLGDVLPEVTA